MRHVHKGKALVRSARVLCGALLLAGSIVGAWAAGPAASGIAACRHIADDRQRLECFDRESSPQLQQPQQSQQSQQSQQPQSRAAHGEKKTESAPAVKTVLTPEQRIGLTPERILKLEGAQEHHDLKELTAKVRAVAGDPGARRSFILENGQVWRQVEPDSEFYVRPGDTVRISKALFGSYFMSVNPHMNTRVSRAR